MLSAFHNFLGICLLVCSCLRAAVDETVSEYGDGIMVNFFQGFSSSGRSGQWREARGDNFARNFEERDHQKQRTEKARKRASNALGKKRSLARKFVDYAKTDQPLSEILKGNERTRRNFPKRPSNLLRIIKVLDFE